MLNVSETSETVMFGLEDPIGVVERFATAPDRQRLELRQWHNPSFYNCPGLELELRLFTFAARRSSA
jgi:hypothetical protein